MKRGQKIIISLISVLVMATLLASGCIPMPAPTPTTPPAWVTQKEKLETQLNYLTGELASAKAELKKAKAELAEMKSLVPPYVESKPVTIDPGKTALIIVDMQNDFLKLGGKLGPTDAKGAQYCATIISHVKALLDRCREAGMPVIYTQDYHYPDDPEFAIWPPHCEVGTPGVEIVPELAPEPGDYIIRKGGKTVSYDCFFASHEPNEMENVLKKLGVDTVIVTGTVSNICVYAAVVGCAQRGYKTIVPRDCIASLAPYGERLALNQFSALYRVIVTESKLIRFFKYGAEVEKHFSLYKALQPLPLMTKAFPEFSYEDAYTFQEELAKAFENSGDKLIGYKLGLTGPKKPFGATEAVYGRLFASMLKKEGEVIKSSDFIKPMIEVEICFKFAKEVGYPITKEELKKAIKEVAPAVELPDLLFADIKNLSWLDLIADDVAPRQLIIGKGRAPDLDINAVKTVAKYNGKVINEAPATDAMGDQWEALLFLVQKLSSRGYKIRPGDIVITGALGKMLPGKPGTYNIDYGELGSLSFEIQ